MKVLLNPDESTNFDYEQSFARNIGLVTPAEQQILRKSTIAIPGLGGVGGIHLMTLARIGIGGFHVSDEDTFELANMNRQIGAVVSSLGQSKSKIMSSMALDVNPEIQLKTWDS